jgi:hypothetical protein
MTEADISRRFTYHAPQPDQIEKYVRIRDTAAAFARLINELAPNNREKSMCISHLDAAVMNANASIARGPETPLYTASNTSGPRGDTIGGPG